MVRKSVSIKPLLVSLAVHWDSHCNNSFEYFNWALSQLPREKINSITIPQWRLTEQTQHSQLKQPSTILECAFIYFCQYAIVNCPTPKSPPPKKNCTEMNNIWWLLMGLRDSDDSDDDWLAVSISGLSVITNVTWMYFMSRNIIGGHRGLQMYT